MTTLSSTHLFESYRSKLVGLAYRITGSRFEADDIVQEAFLKWRDVAHDELQSPYAWLVTVTTRLALDHLKRAQSQRETYIGPWLPEPFLEEASRPDDEHEMDESITMALMLLLERLTASERAVFILHDVFHFQFDEIAAILKKTAVTCRKLASRAREKIDNQKLKQSFSQDEYQQVVTAFLEAVKLGELDNLVSLLRDNVVLHVDGGGKVAAARRILQGAQTVARFLAQVVSPDLAKLDDTDTRFSFVWFNGAPGLVFWGAGKPVSAFNFVIVENRIEKIHVLRNPDKLKFFELH